MKIIIQYFCSILVSILFLSCQNSADDKKALTFQEIILNSETKLFYVTRSGGLVGSVEEIAFVKDTNNYSSEKITFYTDQIYFKVENEKVKIFAPKPSYKNTDLSYFAEEIEIHDLQNSAEILDYKHNFKNYGLNVISIK